LALVGWLANKPPICIIWRPQLTNFAGAKFYRLHAVADGNQHIGYEKHVRVLLNG